LAIADIGIDLSKTQTKTEQKQANKKFFLKVAKPMKKA